MDHLIGFLIGLCTTFWTKCHYLRQIAFKVKQQHHWIIINIEINAEIQHQQITKRLDVIKVRQVKENTLCILLTMDTHTC